MPTITDLPARIQALPTALHTVSNILQVGTAIGHLNVPESMHVWVEQRFGALTAVREQTIVKIVNRLTLEGALFNPTRALRPASSYSDDQAIDAWVAEELAEDLFADPLRMTPADSFGRIEGQFCITASNIAKYDGWHGVVVCNEPHPLRFTREQVVDYVDSAWRWISAAYASDPAAIYPLITWNCLPKSGASLAHGHLQIALGRDMPYSQVERWRQAAAHYRTTTGSNYITGLAALHHALGLGLVPYHGVERFLHLTPARNNEVVLIDYGAWPLGSAPPNLAEAIYNTLAALMSACGTRAFNVAIAFPPLATDGRDWRDMPVYARIGDRGDALAIRSDIGVMELYGMPVITADPFVAVEAIEPRTKN